MGEESERITVLKAELAVAIERRRLCGVAYARAKVALDEQANIVAALTALLDASDIGGRKAKAVRAKGRRA